MLDVILILHADHELNASAFTVRCAASTGLNLYDAMIAGLVERWGGIFFRKEPVEDDPDILKQRIAAAVSFRLGFRAEFGFAGITMARHSGSSRARQTR